MKSRKAIDLLTICRKAGKLVCGFDSSVAAAADGTARCTLAASDASQKTVKELAFKCSAYGCPHYITDFTVDETEERFGKRFSVFAVCDKGFANAFEKLCGKSEE